MRQFILFIILSFAIGQPVESNTGYLRQIEFSFCQDACSQFYIESETNDSPPISVIFLNEFTNIEMYINRFVEIEIGNEIICVECSAFEVETIKLSDECLLLTNCFVDPCEVAGECQINTPVECISNYCDGCYADFYDMNDQLVDCFAPIVDV